MQALASYRPTAGKAFPGKKNDSLSVIFIKDSGNMWKKCEAGCSVRPFPYGYYSSRARGTKHFLRRQIHGLPYPGC